ncbi:hypothetical protein KC320_g280 [Hortaea werneckii]|nr:hypothetical protein KC320_g280 [Hortaea werneckii]
MGRSLSSISKISPPPRLRVQVPFSVLHRTPVFLPLTSGRRPQSRLSLTLLQRIVSGTGPAPADLVKAEIRSGDGTKKTDVFFFWSDKLTEGVRACWLARDTYTEASIRLQRISPVQSIGIHCPPFIPAFGVTIITNIVSPVMVQPSMLLHLRESRTKGFVSRSDSILRPLIHSSYGLPGKDCHRGVKGKYYVWTGPHLERYVHATSGHWYVEACGLAAQARGRVLEKPTLCATLHRKMPLLEENAMKTCQSDDLARDDQAILG